MVSVQIFGVTNGRESDLDYVGVSSNGSTGEADLLNCLSSYRQNIRSTSQVLLNELKSVEGISNDSEGMKLVKQLLQYCDDVRDDDLVELGIQLEDMPSGPVWKICTKEELLRERGRKVQEEERKKQQKIENERIKVREQ